MSKPKMSEILELSVEERILLVQDIWDSIAELPQSLELTEEQKTEIDRRIANLDRDLDSAISWEQLKARVGL